MNQLVDAALQFPTVVFTIALGVAMVYWLFVLLGALDLDLFGDADVSGAAKGVGEALTGGGKGAGEALAGGAKAAGEALTGGAKAAGHGLGDSDGGVDGDGGGVWNSLGLGDVPVTISVSLIVLLSWTGSLLVMHHLAGSAGWLRAVVLVAAIIVALPIAALLVRPLAPIFAVKEAKSSADYIGHICTITTGTVDDRFGQATIEDGGSVLVIQVRCDRPGALARGDKALMIDFDRERVAYLVEPAGEALPSETSRPA